MFMNTEELVKYLLRKTANVAASAAVVSITLLIILALAVYA